MLDNPPGRMDELQAHHNNSKFLLFLLIRKADDYRQWGGKLPQTMIVALQLSPR